MTTKNFRLTLLLTLVMNNSQRFLVFICGFHFGSFLTFGVSLVRRWSLKSCIFSEVLKIGLISKELLQEQNLFISNVKTQFARQFWVYKSQNLSFLLYFSNIDWHNKRTTGLFHNSLNNQEFSTKKHNLVSQRLFSSMKTTP